MVKQIYPDKKHKEIKELRKQLSCQVMNFFVDRLNYLLKENYQIRQDIINQILNEYSANISSDKKGDLLHLINKSIFINDFILDKSNHKIIALYKRVVNIAYVDGIPTLLLCHLEVHIFGPKHIEP